LTGYHQVEQVWLCSSGTLAVELALRGLKVEHGDEVILAGYDFAGNFRAVEAVDAWPVLVDIDRSNWCLDIDQLDAAHSPATRAIIVSHLHGGLVDMPRLIDWAKARNVLVVEDACQAPGAMIGGRRAGTWGDVGVLSFGGSKLLTAGRGGALLVRQAEVWQRIKIYAERGNNAFPLSELQASVLPAQIALLDQRNKQRRAAVAQLLAATSDLPGLRPVSNRIATDDEPCYYKLAWLYDRSAFDGLAIDKFVQALQAEGAPVDRGFRGFTTRSARRCRQVGDLAASRASAENTLVLHHPILLESPEVIGRLAGALRKVVDAIGR
jgi:dTDP-4-amino-4,6-dideoxygalactose transaminase